MMRALFAVAALLPTVLLLPAPAGAATSDPTAPDPTALINGAMQQWRGASSYTEVTMTVHRPDWERRLEVQAWTRGDDDSLVRFTAPPKDAGNATLMLGGSTWVFNPKINQVIQLPAGMMSQSWMGSDFSYDDLAKSTSLLTDYTHKLLSDEPADGHRVYTIEALPKADAPVVWGKQTVKVRDDRVLLQETFYDQDMKPVRELDTTRVAPLGGRVYPVEMTMKPLDQPNRWTRIVYTVGRFDLKLPDYLFTHSNLRNPRPWKLPPGTTP